MKASTILKRASVHYDKSTELIGSLREKLVVILGDDCAHISFSTDGLVIVYDGGMGNAAINLLDIDEFMKLTNKKEALEILDRARI